jgi:hypothetical protein
VRAAVILLLANSIDDDRQLRICVAFCERYGLQPVGISHDGAAVVAMVVGGEVSAVVAALCPHGDPLAETEAQVIQRGGSWLYARRQAARVVDETERLIRTALRNSGNDIELVSRLLGVPRSRVEQLIPDVTGRRAHRIH